MRDLIILGNGMAGMTAALYAKRANLDFEIISKDEFDFGQIGDAILVDNYPCAAGLTGFDLAMKLHDQLTENNIEIKEHEIDEINGITYASDNKVNWLVHATDDFLEETKTIIYAFGATHRQLACPIDSEVKIHHCAICDGPLYKNKVVAVIGGGDSAFSQAEFLSKICKEVHIIMCDENITAAPVTFKRVSKIENINITYNYPVSSIHKNENKYTIFSKSTRGFINVDGIFVAIGMMPNTNLLTNHRLKGIIDNNGYIIAKEDGVTSAPGFFVAGDVRTKQLRQSITAAADGANAVQSVIDYLKNEVR